MILMAGCGTQIVYVRDPTKSETELRVEAIRQDLLIECEGIVLKPPTNNVGNLLIDYNDVTTVGAKCIARQRELVRYLKPVVAAEKARVSTEVKK